MEQKRNEWVMHVWGKKRDTLELNDIEKYHIDLFRLYPDWQKGFDKILINIALDDIDDMDLFNFLKEEIGKVLVNKNVEFRYCQNIKEKGEYVTFRPYVFDRIGEDVNIFYSHFKGYGTFVRIHKESYPLRMINLCEMFWSYIMYRYSLDDFKDVEENLKDHSVYCWFVLKNNADEHNIGFFNDYTGALQSGDKRFKEYVADDLHKHSPGSFVWYNMKRISEVLKDKPLITSVTTEYLIEHSDPKIASLCTHFCESYLMNYLDEEECYSVKDYNKEVHTMKSTIYTQIYPSKKVAREYLPDFEKYLIDNQLI